MARDGFMAVVGARALPEAWAPQVAEVVRFFLRRGWGIGSGGARGADEYALRAVLAAGRAACSCSVVLLPGSLAEARGGLVRVFVRRGGRVVEGSGSGRAALLARSRRLARESAGVVAFLYGPSPGSVFTAREAIRAGKPVAVVVAGGGAALAHFSGGRWEACALGPVAAFRWVAEASEEAEPKPTALARIFVVPEGEPVHELLAHISGLSQGERLWFEQGVLIGDTVLAPHESCSDGKPARLAVDRVMRRLRCTAREAWELGELLLALEAGPEVMAHYEAEARSRGIGAVLQELYWLVVDLARAEEVSEADALAHAEPLNGRAEWVTTEGVLPLDPAASEDEPGFSPEAWHRLGSIHREVIRCPGCGLSYKADDDAGELPACPRCGVADTWEARQDPGFRALIAEIEACPSLRELATLGKRLYALRLSDDQAGVAWSHYQIRKAKLEAGLRLGLLASAVLLDVNEAHPRVLRRYAAWLYHRQRAKGSTLCAPEWRRIWQAYQARRAVWAA
ncbi:MAG: DNA-processing protein DprA [Candidatus Rokubacteria bacterium]|nr:DNA-processing protein DprA [Candidatus Rokubacteria bacterium]